ncbi:MAG: MoxR-like ATPase [Fimbriimonadaceae bacterium]|jgi:MoxR-like ATPase|nr:MoxR-like ATPase [Fimbriimonadaceae bacterium]
MSITELDTPPAGSEEAARQVAEVGAIVLANVEKVVVGKTQVIQTAIASLLAGGHVLLEDAPGVAKTVLVKALAKSLGLSFKRVQCTPDLLPTDVTGASVFNQKTVDFEFRHGPVFANLVLVDELNRATPRTQSALLECMAEGQTTIDDKTYILPQPFQVFATQNPFEYEGTFPLPEAQLDRFAIRMRIGYPSEADEIMLLETTRERHPLESISAVADAETLIAAQAAVRQVYINAEVRAYIAKLVRATRAHGDVAIGASPRASMALFHLSQAASAVAGRDYVVPDTVRMLAPMVIEHRLSLKPEARIRGRTAANIVNDILERTSAPTPSRK